MKTIPTRTDPWWKHGHVWLVVSGPALVVVASVVTVVLAVKHPDAVIGGQAPAQASRAVVLQQPRALAPAMEGRNHAATPDKAARP